MTSHPASAPDAAAFEGLANFRDFGGMPAPGGRVAQGRLFRSAHHAGATAADLVRLGELGLRVLVDLRRPTERERDPSPRPIGFSAEVIASDDGDRAEPPHIEFLRRGDLSDAAVDRFFIDYYREAPFEPRHLDLFARAFAALERTGGPLLIHCAAGKDRTGVLAALILLSLGVEMGPVRDDFLATNATMITDTRAALVRDSLQAQLGEAPSDKVVRYFLGVRAEFLDAMLETLEARAGGLDAYLERIGVGAARRDALRGRLVVAHP